MIKDVMYIKNKDRVLMAISKNNSTTKDFCKASKNIKIINYTKKCSRYTNSKSISDSLDRFLVVE